MQHNLLPPPPKVDGDYVFTQVCLYVSEQDISKDCGRIQTKFGGQVGYVTRTSILDFGEELDLEPDMIIFKRFFIIEN